MSNSLTLRVLNLQLTCSVPNLLWIVLYLTISNMYYYFN
jgi:hypothetical protein